MLRFVFFPRPRAKKLRRSRAREIGSTRWRASPAPGVNGEGGWDTWVPYKLASLYLDSPSDPLKMVGHDPSLSFG